MAEDKDFPCSLVIDIPFPTNRLASAAIRTLSVDQELSALVQRDFDLVAKYGEEKTVLRTTYRATTNRMLRVAVNGFFESMGVVLQVMEELDTDVIHEMGFESMERVQGVEQGMTGSTVTGG
ncbi:hypothetical protein M8818_002075 [Zalaria obscura]|uniref:Uncharacterized protein n=1 Tax=Zalaria obscura TaxID=2024903 RepID=A0ACC3SIW5_9PEZI